MSASLEVEIQSDNTSLIKTAAREAVQVALEAVGLQAETYAKYKITEVGAVDTGNLRNSITHTYDADEVAAYVGTNVEYAPYVEYGTSKMPARPFIKPAVNDHIEEYKNIFETYLRSADDIS